MYFLISSQVHLVSLLIYCYFNDMIPYTVISRHTTNTLTKFLCLISFTWFLGINYICTLIELKVGPQ